MAHEKITIQEFTNFRKKEEQVLLDATACSILKFMAANGWKLEKELRVKSDGGSSKVKHESIPNDQIGALYNQFDKELKQNRDENKRKPITNRTTYNPGYIIRATKELRPGKTQTIKLQPGKNGYLLWVDYTKDYNLGIIPTPPAKWFTLLKGEQALLAERWDKVNEKDKQWLAPLVELNISIENLGESYRVLEPLRKYNLTNFKKEVVNMLDFDPSIRHWYMHKNNLPGASSSNGGGFYSLCQASPETAYKKAIVLAKIKRDSEMEAWLTLKENVEVRQSLRQLAYQFGDKESLNKFYALNKDSFTLISNKEREIVEGTDTLFKAKSTIKDLALEHGFTLKQAKNERDVYTRSISIDDSVKVDTISFPRLYPYVYMDENTKRGGNVESFSKEYKQQTPQASALNDIKAIAEKNKLKLDLEQNQRPANPNLLLANQQKLFK